MYLHINTYIYKWWIGGLLCWSSGKDSMLRLPGVEVRSLVKEPDPTCLMAQSKNKNDAS